MGAGGPLHEVFCMGNVCACTGFACFAVTVVTSAVLLEGVVVLKGDADFPLDINCLDHCVPSFCPHSFC